MKIKNMKIKNMKIKNIKFLKWLVEEELEAKQVNTIFNEIGSIFWNLLLINGGAIFFMASLFWIVFGIPFNILEEEAMHL